MLLGRREIAQLTAVELIIIAILGSAVETAMIAGNTSLAAGLVSATTLLLANRALSILVRRSRRVRHLLLGGPILLVNNGRMIYPHLQRAGLTEANVEQAIRERGYDVSECRAAVLEIDGSVGVVPQSAPVHRGRAVKDTS